METTILEKRVIMSEANQAIKPTLWFTNSILDFAKFITEKEIRELKKLTNKTQKLKKESWKTDNKVSTILSKIIDRGEINVCKTS